jgi:site-specific recombinase XerD
MEERIVVRVVEFSDRRHYQMQYRDPNTGRKITRSTKVERTGRKRERADAERVAAQLAAELRTGQYREPSKITWKEFRERYENEVLSSLAEKTDLKVAGVFNAVESIINPQRLRDVDERRISHYQSELRRNGLAESTIKGHLAHLASALNWAERSGLLPKAPNIEMPKRAKSSKVMKGRPITAEEFERMLGKVASVVGKAAAPSWKHYLRGLWWSGLRLSESLELWWDRDNRLCVDLSQHHPMLRIPAACEKGNRDRLLPIAPEFAEFILAVPAAQRTGRIFSPQPGRVRGERLSVDRVSRIVGLIGKAAGVKVATDAKGKVKFASAHDLRRSFGRRWAARIMPPDLMVLMRHEDINTTMKFYVGRDADETAKTLWEAFAKATGGNSFGNSADFAPVTPSPENATSPVSSGACDKFGN